MIRNETCSEIQQKCFRLKSLGSSVTEGVWEQAVTSCVCSACSEQCGAGERRSWWKCLFLTSAHSSAHEHWKAKWPDWGGNCLPRHWCKRQLGAGDTHPTGDNAKQHLQSREQLSSGWRKGCSLLGFQHPQSSRRSLRQSGNHPWIHQVTHMHSVLSEGPDCLVQSEPRLPVPSPACCVPTAIPHASGRWEVLHEAPSPCSSGWLPQSKDDKTVSCCTHHFIFSSHHKEIFHTIHSVTHLHYPHPFDFLPQPGGFYPGFWQCSLPRIRTF